jgi:hypothetical protein
MLKIRNLNLKVRCGLLKKRACGSSQAVTYLAARSILRAGDIMEAAHNVVRVREAGRHRVRLRHLIAWSVKLKDCVSAFNGDVDLWPMAGPSTRRSHEFGKADEK